jgi:DNA-binding transcriptional LysR family regulator
MTLEQLRIFVAVAEKQHVTRASSELNLTQSATSAAIAALEARYGIKLFDRIGRGIVLTQTGKDFLVEARAVLARAKDATRLLNDLAGLKRGSLSIAASQTVGNYWLPRRIQTFRAAYPGIELRLAISNTKRAARMVIDGSADLGFVEGEVNESLLSAKKIEGDALILAVGVRHPWVNRAKVSAKDLPATSWVLRERGSGTRSMFEAALRHNWLRLSDLQIALELPSNEAVRSAVEAGDGATAVSDLVAAPSIAAKTLHRVRFDLPRRSFYILRHKERHISRAEDALLKSLR